jgi:hypothetical protein
MSDVPRPISITVIAWLEIGSAALGLCTLLLAVLVLRKSHEIDSLTHSRIPLAAQIVLGALGIIVMVAVGMGLLKGANWARYLYIAWGGFGIVQSFVFFHVTPQQLIPLIFGCTKYVVFVYFLFRRDADVYFRGNAQA